MEYKLPKNFKPNKHTKPGNMKELFEYGRRNNSDMTLYTFKNKKDIVHMKYSAFGKIVDNFGTGLFKLGLMGKNIALLSESRYEWTASYFAAANGNGVIIPLDKELEEEQIINFTERADSDCIVYSDMFAGVIEKYAENKETKIKYFINMDASSEQASEKNNERIISFAEVVKLGEEAVKNGCRDFIDCVVDSEKMCACIFTSGTTGTSKAVKLSHKNIAFVAHRSACCVKFEKGDVVMSVLPIHHTYETSCTIFATFMIGLNVCFNDSLKMVMKNFQIYKPNKMVLVPLFVDNIVKKIWDEIEKKGKTQTVKTAIKLSGALRKIGIDLRRTLFKDIINAFGGRLEVIICGGAPLNPDHVRTLDAFGIELCQGYGITECAPLISVVPYGDMVMKKVGSVGYPIMGVTVKIDKIPGENYGEVLAKGDNVMLGYTDDEQTREVMTDDGFFRTGDIGYLDGDGYIYITGRKKNVIILSNGKNIYPEEIEEYLYKNNKISECAVVARHKNEKDLKSEQILTAYIYPDFDRYKDGGGERMPLEKIEEDIKNEVSKINKNLPPFKHINNVIIRTEEFEKTTSKKIIRYKIK